MLEKGPCRYSYVKDKRPKGYHSELSEWDLNPVINPLFLEDMHRGEMQRAVEECEDRGRERHS